jgi:hypothetical protein
MSSRTRIIVTALLTLAALAPRTSESQRASVCGDAEKRDWLRSHIEPLMLSADSAASSERRQLHLPLVHPDSIIYVDDERICARAAKAYYRERLGPRPLRGVSVAKVGEMWVVYGEKRAGEWTILGVLNRDFVEVAGVMT